MAADDSSVDGRMIRVRAWACRPKELPAAGVGGGRMGITSVEQRRGARGRLGSVSKAEGHMPRCTGYTATPSGRNGLSVVGIG